MYINIIWLTACNSWQSGAYLGNYSVVFTNQWDHFKKWD